MKFLSTFERLKRFSITYSSALCILTHSTLLKSIIIFEKSSRDFSRSDIEMLFFKFSFLPHSTNFLKFALNLKKFYASIVM